METGCLSKGLTPADDPGAWRAFNLQFKRINHHSALHCRTSDWHGFSDLVCMFPQACTSHILDDRTAFSQPAIFFFYIHSNRYTLQTKHQCKTSEKVRFSPNSRPTRIRVLGTNFVLNRLISFCMLDTKPKSNYIPGSNAEERGSQRIQSPE